MKILSFTKEELTNRDSVIAPPHLEITLSSRARVRYSMHTV